MVNISEAELKKLERAQAKLDALESGGVDNWEWYDESLKDFRKNEEKEGRLEELLEEIEVALLEGAYEPSERGAGYATHEDARNNAYKVLITHKVTFEDLTNDK